MTARDVCEICGGTMQLVNLKTKLPMPCKCKDTFGSKPEAWRREQTRVKKAEDLRSSK
jgi:hypothetical protein